MTDDQPTVADGEPAEKSDAPATLPAAATEPPLGSPVLRWGFSTYFMLGGEYYVGS
jgi:hypothetical protein